MYPRTFPLRLSMPPLRDEHVWFLDTTYISLTCFVYNDVNGSKKRKEKLYLERPENKVCQTSGSKILCKSLDYCIWMVEKQCSDVQYSDVENSDGTPCWGFNGPEQFVWMIIHSSNTSTILRLVGSTNISLQVSQHGAPLQQNSQGLSKHKRQLTQIPVNCNLNAQLCITSRRSQGIPHKYEDHLTLGDNRGAGAMFCGITAGQWTRRILI